MILEDVGKVNIATNAYDISPQPLGQRHQASQHIEHLPLDVQVLPLIKHLEKSHEVFVGLGIFSYLGGGVGQGVIGG